MDINKKMIQEMYCLRCKEKVTTEVEELKTKNGKNACKGKCPKCGTNLFRFLKRK